MDNAKRLPISLTIVASLFSLVGIISLVEVIASGAKGRLSINLGVLGLFIGIGLWRRNRAWRTCALVILGLLMVAIPLCMLGDLLFTVVSVSDRHGRPISHVTAQQVRLALAACGFVLTCWQYWVLTRRSTRRLFQVSGAPSCAGFGLVAGATVCLIVGFFTLLVAGVPFGVLWMSRAASSSSGPSYQFGTCEDVEWYDDYPLLGGTSAKYAIWGEGLAVVIWVDRRADSPGTGGGTSQSSSGQSMQVSSSTSVPFDDTNITLECEIEGTLDAREGTLSINGVTYNLAHGSLFLVTIKDPNPVVVQVDRDTMTMKPGKESLVGLAREDPEVAAFLAGSKGDK